MKDAQVDRSDDITKEGETGIFENKNYERQQNSCEGRGSLYL